MNSNPIGIFDSGVGGLMVCKAIHELMPVENLIYFGDTARFPYGTRSTETIVRYSRQITDYLISRGVKMIVIACNTASAAALDTLREDYDIPIIGVVEAGARAGCRRLKNNSIGVIGTRATVNSGSYIRAINSINSEIQVLQHQATLFVSLAEEGMTKGEIARLTVREYIQDMYNKGVRTLILGCTHFPLLKETIQEVYADIDCIDTAMEIAIEIQDILSEQNMFKSSTTDQAGNIELYASDITESMERLKSVFFSNRNIEITKLIINGGYNDQK